MLYLHDTNNSLIQHYKFTASTILFAYVPVLIWTMSQQLSTFPVNNIAEKLDWGVQSLICAGLLTTAFLACLYHLVLLSVLRFYAIKNVFKMRQLSKTKTITMTSVLWIMSFLGGFNPRLYFVL